MKNSARLTLLAMLACGAVFGQTPAALAVVNYAGYTGTFPVAPGSIASAYGAFGNVATTSAESLNPMPTTLAGLSVRVNNVAAPLYFVSGGQINLVIPVGTPEGRQTVEVVQGGNVIARGTVNVHPVGPGLAQSDTQTTGQGILQNQDFSINSQTARARRGEVIQIYATGCGATTPALEDGRPPAALSPARAEVKAFIDVREAAVAFAGAHPQFPGICQVNAVVPNVASISGRVTLFLTVNGIASNPVSFWVE
jgi:uncharacterized protein (TIGR03437 family)